MNLPILNPLAQWSTAGLAVATAPLGAAVLASVFLTSRNDGPLRGSTGASRHR